MTILQLGLLLQTLAGAGYQFPPAVTVAPGQVIPLLVTGLKTVLPVRVEAQNVPLPVNLAGISVTLYQTLPDRSWPLPIFAIQQTNNCGTSMAAACQVTAITVQMPYDITVPNYLFYALIPQSDSTLTITENGVTSQTFYVHPVTDRVHILQSCDINAQTYAGYPCYPLVFHPDGSLVSQDLRGPGGVAQTHTEAQPGETLVMYAYGLGGVTTPVQLGAPSPIPPAVAAEAFFIRDDYSVNAGPSMPEWPQTLPVAYSQYTQPVFAGLTPGQIGLYQINFIVPPPPAGTPYCGWPVVSNLTVSVLAGGGSFDGAAICVDPGVAAP